MMPVGRSRRGRIQVGTRWRAPVCRRWWWRRASVEPATVSRDLGLHLSRFVMMEHMVSREEVFGFLHELKDALAALQPGLGRAHHRGTQRCSRLLPITSRCVCAQLL